MAVRPAPASFAAAAGRWHRLPPPLPPPLAAPPLPQ